MGFDQSFDRLMLIEGGYVNNPNDPGKETNLGITWPTLRKAIYKNIVDSETTIKSLTVDQAKLIYKALFWDEAKLDSLDDALAYQVFDFSVNSSIKTAIRKLQSVVGVIDDGIIGPKTMGALQKKSIQSITTLYIAERLEFLTCLSAWKHFNKGWARRQITNLRYSVKDW